MRAALPAVAFMLAAVFGLSACASTQPDKKENLVDRDGIDVIGSPGDRVHLAIKDARSFERYCKGPGPDFSVTVSNGMSVGTNAGVLPVGGSVGESSGRGAVDLGGRNPAVLLAREMFYRTCELTLNTNLDSKSAIALYKMTLDSVERIAALQTGAGTATATAAPPPAQSGLPATIQNAPTITALGQTIAVSTSGVTATPSDSSTTPATPDNQ